jgi:DNA-directed RNA polymerase subunit RPC12/RpoP
LNLINTILNTIIFYSLQLLALFDIDCPMDPFAMFDRDALTIKNTNYKSYFGININEDIDEWLNSIITFDEPQIKLLGDKKMEESVIQVETRIFQSNSVWRYEDGAIFKKPKKYKCPFCVKRFYNKRSYYNHGTSHAKRQLRCMHCRYRTRSLEALVRHNNYYHCFVQQYSHLPSF